MTLDRNTIAILAKRIVEEKPQPIEIRIWIEKLLEEELRVMEQPIKDLAQLTEAYQDLSKTYWNLKSDLHTITSSCACENCRRIFEMTYPIYLAA